MVVKKITEFFKCYSDLKIWGNPDQAFSFLTSDSRETKPGCLYVALRGEVRDGHQFIEEAIEKGARAILCETVPRTPSRDITWIQCNDTKEIFPKIVKQFYGDPAKKIKLVGITGTNGKTTVSYLIDFLLNPENNSFLIGTVEYRIKDKRFSASNTTPGIMEMTRLMDLAVKGNIRYGVLEVSSHALKQKRLSDYKFETAIFTNLTQDHLDYHSTLDDYFNSKKKLFSEHTPEKCIINQDDEYGRKLIQDLRAEGREVVTYSIREEADSWASDIISNLDGVSFKWHFRGAVYSITSSLVCNYNVSNLVAALTAVSLEDIQPEEVIPRLTEFQGIPGRMERVGAELPFTVFVDYAHTPDAITNVLRSVSEIKIGEKGKVITIFGCGGDRDKTKRPLMAEAVQNFSDKIFVTSDNPRTENPEQILDNITANLSKPYCRIPDREEAIKKALEDARPHDILLILGKGHEDYQIIGTEKKYFSDKKVVNSWIASKSEVSGLKSEVL